MPRTRGSLKRIGELARAAGVAATTLRYYEREGLLTPTVRSASGYRLYDTEALERLQFIRAAQAVGFALDDIRALLELDAQNAKTCQADVQPLIERRIAEIDRKMKNLKRVRATLGRALDRCRRSKGECAVLKDIRPGKNKRRQK